MIIRFSVVPRRPKGLVLALATALVAVAALVGVADPARAFTLKAAHAHGEVRAELRHRVMETLATALAQRTGGVTIKIYPRESLFRESELWTGLTSGTLEIAALPLARLRGLDPIFAAPSLPGLVPNEDQAHLFANGPAMAKVVQALEARGVRVLTHVWVPGVLLTRGGTCLALPTEMVGEAVASGGRMIGDMAQAQGAERLPDDLGVDPRLLDGPQGVDVLATTEMDLAAGSHPEASACVTLGNGYTPWFDYEPIVISQRAWDLLSPSQRQALTEAAGFAESYGRQIMERSLRTRLSEVVGDGLSWSSFTEADYRAWRRLSLPVLANLVDLPLSVVAPEEDKPLVTRPEPEPEPEPEGRKVVVPSGPETAEEPPTEGLGADTVDAEQPRTRVVIRRAPVDDQPGTPRTEGTAIAEPEAPAETAAPPSAPRAEEDPAAEVEVKPFIVPLGLGP